MQIPISIWSTKTSTAVGKGVAEPEDGVKEGSVYIPYVATSELNPTVLELALI